MHNALVAKFPQNKSLMDTLKNTGDKILAEATTNRYWGTGKPIQDRHAYTDWQGQNFLGQVLMTIRTEVKSD